MSVRRPAVSGLFYPEQANQLRQQVMDFVQHTVPDQSCQPKAIVVPHAGFPYSGPIAGSAYAQIVSRRAEIRRVVLLGPAHRVAFRGIALPTVRAFASPLGEVPLDLPGMALLGDLPQVIRSDEAHAREHCLEVQLPFLQQILADFTLLPMLVGSVGPQAVANALDLVWGQDETLIVVSSDLSHYESYQQAQQHDRHTSDVILTLDSVTLVGSDACGCNPLNGFLQLAREKQLQARLLDLRNSGDTAGDKDRVVGYGAYAFY